MKRVALKVYCYRAIRFFIIRVKLVQKTILKLEQHFVLKSPKNIIRSLEIMPQKPCMSTVKELSWFVTLTVL